MKDFVVYNNPDTVGELYKKEPLSVFTNKRVSQDVIGSRVWLIAGAGKPRRYYLRCWFFVDNVSSGSEHGFATRVSGVDGEVLDPMIEIPRDEWFLEFKKDQGQFAFGFSSIKDTKTVRYLERLLPK